MLNKIFGSNLRAILSYSTINVFLILLGLIGLPFQVWEISAVLSICFPFGIFVLLIMFSNISSKINENQISAGKAILFSVLRFVCMSLGLILSFILIYFTQSDLENKFRYLYVLLAGIPLFLTIMTFYLRGETNGWAIR